MTTPEAGRRAEVIAVILRGLKAYAPDEVETYGHDEAEMIADYVVPYVATAIAQAVQEENEACAAVAQGVLDECDCVNVAAKESAARHIGLIVGRILARRAPTPGTGGPDDA
jgi:hypothetical protein